MLQNHHLSENRGSLYAIEMTSHKDHYDMAELVSMSWRTLIGC